MNNPSRGRSSWPAPEHLHVLIIILLLLRFCIYERLHEPCFTPAIING